MPERVRMSRQRPWRHEHPTAFRVDRATRWGNPIRIDGKRVTLNGIELYAGTPATPDVTVADFAVRAYRWQLTHHPNVIGYTIDDIRRELAGRDLACWCPLVDADGRPHPCHADVLLELANRFI